MLRASSFEEALIIAANHDGDSDSTASIAGQIYGVWHGDCVLPRAWIEKLDIVEVMETLVVEFMAVKAKQIQGSAAPSHFQNNSVIISV